MTTVEQATVAAPLTMNATVATLAMAVLTKTGSGVTTDKGECDQGDERRERNSEKTLHFFLRRRDSKRRMRFAGRRHAEVDSGRPPNRSIQEHTFASWQPVGTTRGTPLQVLQVGENSQKNELGKG